MFIVGKIVGALLCPPGFCILLGSLGLVFLLLKWRRAGIACIATGLLSLALASSMIVASAMIEPLEASVAALDAERLGAEARQLPIVVLGGGAVDPEPPDASRDSLAPETAARAAYGARLAALTSGSILFEGGVPDLPGFDESTTVKNLWLGLGLPASRILTDSSSLDTADNARGAAALLGKGRIILVTSAWHMPRSVLAFRKAGFEVLPAPCAYRSRHGAISFLDLLPSASALTISAAAVHEYIGLLWYRIRPASR